MKSPVYISILSGTHSGKRYSVTGSVTIGRSATNALSFPGVDAGIVSGLHAILQFEQGRLFITDKNSKNGTYINGKRTAQAELFHNDIVSFGQNGPKIRIEYGDPGIQKDFKMDFPSSSKSGSGSTFNRATRKEFQNRIDSNAGHYTQELAKKLNGGKIGKRELGELIKNKKRLNRIQSSHLVGKENMVIVNTAAETFQQYKKAAFISIIVILVLAGSSITFLLIKNISYRKMIVRQKILVENISNLNAKFRIKTSYPEEDEEQKLLLLAKIRAQERILTKLRQRLSAKDLVSLYSDTLGIYIHNAMIDFGEIDYIVPEMFIRQVRKYLKIWKNNPAFWKKAFRNKQKHGNMILRELSKAKLPSAFLYLAMHESCLDSIAISRAGARGIWQFMPYTARNYGLKVHKNWREVPVWMDERTNPHKSTLAAIKYIKVLLGQFGTVPLAMAAYNAGEGRILRELRKIDNPINNRDFWYIYRSGTLARETNEYLPKIIATMLIIQNREQFGIKNVSVK